MSGQSKRRLSGFQIFLIFIMGAIALATLAAGAALGGYAWLDYQITRDGPAAPGGESRVVLLEPGSSLNGISRELADEGVISDPLYFKAAAILDNGAGALKAGEYEFESGASVREVYEKIRNGQVVQHPLTIPEGLPSVLVAKLVNEAEVLTGDPVEPPAEGSILPETYMLRRGMARAGLIDRMQAAQDALMEELWPQRDPDLPFETQEEALILASIVEKETGLPEERPEVAGVFINRLREGMRLESDPTIIYGVTRGRRLGRRILQSEIDAVTDWNTYQIDGLPETPIANPGADAIRAVLNPAKHDYLYFVADGSGGHAFARTLAEHNRNVAKWRSIRRQRANGSGQP